MAKHSRRSRKRFRVERLDDQLAAFTRAVMSAQRLPQVNPLTGRRITNVRRQRVRRGERMIIQEVREGAFQPQLSRIRRFRPNKSTETVVKPLLIQSCFGLNVPLLAGINEEWIGPALLEWIAAVLSANKLGISWTFDVVEETAAIEFSRSHDLVDRVRNLYIQQMPNIAAGVLATVNFSDTADYDTYALATAFNTVAATLPQKSDHDARKLQAGLTRVGDPHKSVRRELADALFGLSRSMLSGVPIALHQRRQERRKRGRQPVDAPPASLFVEGETGQLLVPICSAVMGSLAHRPILTFQGLNYVEAGYAVRSFSGLELGALFIEVLFRLCMRSDATTEKARRLWDELCDEAADEVEDMMYYEAVVDDLS